jgi:hypothetical protein
MALPKPDRHLKTCQDGLPKPDRYLKTCQDMPKIQKSKNDYILLISIIYNIF